MTPDEIIAAQAQIDEARAQIAQQQLDAEAAQRPHTALAGIEGYLVHLPTEIAEEFAALVAKAKSLI